MNAESNSLQPKKTLTFVIKRRREKVGKGFAKGGTPRGISSSGRKRNLPWCDSWHPPVCQNDISQTGCSHGGKFSFSHREAANQPNKKQETDGNQAQ